MLSKYNLIMIMLHFVKTFLKFYILGIFVSDYFTEGAAIDERNQACSLREWGCHNGGCVSFEKRCDGEVNCSDGSDEAAEFCSADNFILTEAGSWSDLRSRSKRQSTGCGTGKWTCTDGGCIDSLELCDGAKHCTDGSDETIIQCSEEMCPSYLFRCSYGACVDFQSDCNGVVDCADGSDESPEVCDMAGIGVTPKQSATPSPTPRSCILPPYPHYGTYTTTMGDKPGDAVSYTTLTFSCERSHSLKGKDIVACFMSTWLEELPTCESQCKPLKSHSVDFKCYKQHSTLEVSCDIPQDNKSRAKATCKDSYHLVPPPRDLTCNEGSWDYTPSCTPDCGTVAPQGETLVINGETAKIGDFPWHVGLYEKEAPKIPKCGGSIFGPKLVVTAAHCVYSDNAGLYPASAFTVAAGKIYGRWNAPREDETYVQNIDVMEIEIPERYTGFISSFMEDIAVLVLEKSFLFSSLVRPVCIPFDHKDNLDGKFGKVAGWGLTEEDGNVARILQTVTLPYVNYSECFKNSPESFRPLITYDKICAGYRNGTAVCKGDSGGGLVFVRTNGYQDLHYLYGIVSTSPRNKALTSCNAFAYTAFTNLINHREWFQNLWSMHNTIS